MRAGRLRQNDTVETFVAEPRANDVSVDEQNGMVYWSDQVAGTIQRAPVTDGQNVETVLQGLDHPTGIAIHAASRKLYWAEWNRVRRSNLDGTVLEDLLNLSAYRIGFGPDVFVGVRGTTWGHAKSLYR